MSFQVHAGINTLWPLAEDKRQSVNAYLYINSFNLKSIQDIMIKFLSLFLNLSENICVVQTFGHITCLFLATKFSEIVLLNFGDFLEGRYLFLIHFGFYKDFSSNSLQFLKHWSRSDLFE